MSELQSVEALIVFCEGPHDVAFMDKVLRHCLAFERVREWTFSDYPSPLHTLFSQSVQRHAQQDLSLDMAHKFFLPDRVYQKDQQVVLLFNSGGKTKHAQVSTWLAQFQELLALAESANYGEDRHYIEKACYLFLYDADEDGLEGTCTDSQKWFAEINGEPWLSEWQICPDYPFAALSGNDKALYVWGETPESGTLEDWLLPLFKQKAPELLEKAEASMGELFDWSVSDQQSQVAMHSKYQKAVMTLAGQREKPGGSMSVVIDQAKKRIGKGEFRQDANIQMLAAFLREFMGLAHNE